MLYSLLLAVTTLELVYPSGSGHHFLAADVERMVFRIDFRFVYTIFGLHGAACNDL